MKTVQNDASGYMAGLEIGLSYSKQFPNNCAVIERTGDGISVGVCCFHLENGICPRHGLVKPSVTLSVTLPNRRVIRAKRTGKVCKVVEIPDGGLFEVEGQIWEKVPGSCCNLSDLNDDSEVIGLVRVRELLELK